uniref:Uncharacterized protein n=1 Tax=Sus scrofa TaxID=9823 RepID=A0A4X1U2F2_PIG
MPGTRPMRLTIMCRRLLPVSTFTALPIVVLSRLSPFTSVILSPTHRPARSAGGKVAWATWEKSPSLRLSLPPPSDWVSWGKTSFLSFFGHQGSRGEIPRGSL